MRYLIALILLAACDATGPGDWTHEGVIESGSHMVTAVDQYASITCEVDGQRVETYTGGTPTGPHCLKYYHTVDSAGIIYPLHTLYVQNGPVGRRYRASVR